MTESTTELIGFAYLVLAVAAGIYLLWKATRKKKPEVDFDKEEIPF